MQAAGYTLDLYCDNSMSEKCPYRYKNGSHAEYVDNGRNCKRVCYSMARKDGWRVARKGGKDLCPTCNKMNNPTNKALERSALKPCPFCGSSKVKGYECYGDTWVSCLACKASCGFTLGDPSDKWNTRAQAADGWRPIEEFNGEEGTSWEVVAIYDGIQRHWICKWFGNKQGFSLPGFCGFKVLYFRKPRELPAALNALKSVEG